MQICGPLTCEIRKSLCMFQRIVQFLRVSYCSATVFQRTVQSYCSIVRPVPRTHTFKQWAVYKVDYNKMLYFEYVFIP